ncbi:hypothetical protein [Pseudomonas nitroreducens]|uniref:Uncharacterized protein n=1 Tax=Pseudomonas nitroreducens TaxID=46680 RepID=A0A6G6IVD8_PSENT|nr:hypothetical protein [Pseudomonas nitroreducens]QIE86964.1 hypothetical protein G5B91_12090 [Pseudomonas nitroreducens]
MQASIQHALIIGLAIATAVILVVAWIAVRRAETHGYDLGYGDAKRGHSSHIEALHEDLGLLRDTLRLAEIEHKADREQLLQDCDNRIAHYSRRANPFTDEDAAELLKISGQLKVTAVTAERVGALTHKHQALQAAESATRMAARIRAALVHAEEQESAA